MVAVKGALTLAKPPWMHPTGIMRLAADLLAEGRMLPAASARDKSAEELAGQRRGLARDSRPAGASASGAAADRCWGYVASRPP